MSPHSFIFMGRSGCGKGTQAKMIIETLKKLDPGRKSVYVQTGQELRELIKGESYTQKMVKDIYDVGGLQPEFIAIYVWAKALVDRYTGDEHLVFDGVARKLHEAAALLSVFPFYKTEKPWVINLEITDEEAEKRLMGRKRFDDNKKEIAVRLSWYETEVRTAIEFYRSNPLCNFVTVNGAQSVEKVHADIVKAVGL